MAPIALGIADAVATITLDAPHALMDRTIAADLADAAARCAAAVDDVHAVVVASSGDDFCLGWDTDGLEADESGLAALGAGIEALASMPQPVIAAIHGRAHSAGLELALACDVRVSDDSARFCMPDVGQGAVPHGGATQRLPRAIGRAHALRVLLIGDELDAAEALRVGLVSEVTPGGGHVEAATKLAVAIASRGPVATRMAKEAVSRGIEMTLEQALRYELDLTLLLQTTSDRAEGVRAFAARRPPHFTGR